MTPIFIDTAFVIALINRRDQYHQQAVAIADQITGRSLLVTDAVLFEIGNGLARQFKKQAVAILSEFLAADEIEIIYSSPELFQQAFSLYKTHVDKDWGLVDCLSIAVMRERDIQQVLTFDQHFLQAGLTLFTEVP